MSMKRVQTFNGIVLALLVPFSIYNVARGFTLATVLIILSVLLSINVLGASVSYVGGKLCCLFQ